jgi:outer membrane protein OmpA-like peptidoglycan-associated protein
MTSRLLNRFAVSATAGILVVGCAADGSCLTETGTGAAIGTATGAAAGALIGSLSANAGRGALIGAVGGVIAGGLVGAYMEEQRKDFEKALADEIASGMISVQQLPNNELLVSMTGATTFEVDSDRIQPGFFSTMDKISAIVRKYGKTELLVAGHTDNTGSAEHNQLLSERRANAVASYMLSDGVLPERISARGYGKNQPIASNESESGRSLNRRVDITIVPITA